MVQKRYASMKIIDDVSKRKIAASKRKKGIIKKAMELSILCDQDVFICIFDKSSKRAVRYCSTGEFQGDVQKIDKFANSFTNKDYLNKFAPKFYKDQEASQTESEDDEVDQR